LSCKPLHDNAFLVVQIREKAMSWNVQGMAKSVRRTRSRRMKFCVHGGLGDTLNKQRREPNGYPGALLASFPQE